jgi:hypothetical protein
MLFSNAEGGRDVSREPLTPTPPPPVLDDEREKGRLILFERKIFEFNSTNFANEKEKSTNHPAKQLILNALLLDRNDLANRYNV